MIDLVTTVLVTMTGAMTGVMTTGQDTIAGLDMMTDPGTMIVAETTTGGMIIGVMTDVTIDATINMTDGMELGTRGETGAL